MVDPAIVHHKHYSNEYHYNGTSDHFILHNMVHVSAYTYITNFPTQKYNANLISMNKLSHSLLSKNAGNVMQLQSTQTE